MQSQGSNFDSNPYVYMCIYIFMYIYKYIYMDQLIIAIINCNAVILQPGKFGHLERN
jgi:hypothetical protein